MIDNIKKYGSHNFYLRGITSLIGFNNTKVEFDRKSRIVGTSKYLIGSYKDALNGILNFTSIIQYFSIFAFFLRFSEQKLVFVYKTWARGVLLLIKYIYKIDYKINGLENIPNGSCVIASKHESMWETIIFLILS